MSTNTDHPSGSIDESGSVSLLLEAVRLRDPGLADHGQRAAHLAAAIAEEMSLATAEVERAYLGALLHDIGKLGVSEAILWKPAGLTSDEWRQIRTHPEKGHRLIRDQVHPDVAASVLSHHERLDRMGYPHGIDSRQLSPVVRIVQVADAFDAITSDRPYQAALPFTVATSEIRRCAGTQFDPDVAAGLDRVLDAGAIDVLDLSPSDRSLQTADPFPASA